MPSFSVEFTKSVATVCSSGLCKLCCIQNVQDTLDVRHLYYQNPYILYILSIHVQEIDESVQLCGLSRNIVNQAIMSENACASERSEGI